MVLHLGARLDGCFHDVSGGWEVGLTSTETDDVLALGLQGLGLCVHREGGGLGNSAEAGGNTSQFCWTRHK